MRVSKYKSWNKKRLYCHYGYYSNGSIEIAHAKELPARGYVFAVCRSGYFQLRQFRPVICLLQLMSTRWLCMLLLRANSITTTSCCMHCLFTIPAAASLLNATARLIMGTLITLVLRTSTGCRFGAVDCKLHLLICKSLHGLASSYLVDDCMLASLTSFTAVYIRPTWTMRHPENPYPVRWLELFCCRPACLEQFIPWTTTARYWSWCWWLI